AHREGFRVDVVADVREQLVFDRLLPGRHLVLGIQLPVDLPVNVSGNSVDVVGVLNPATGNTSGNTSGDHPSPPKTTTPKPPAPPKAHHEPKAHHPAAPPARATLAHTGTDLTGATVAGSAALLLAGTALHRRFRPGRTR
ncbi:chaplin, partial [Streptomyces sp. NPDC002172]